MTNDFIKPRLIYQRKTPYWGGSRLDAGWQLGDKTKECTGWQLGIAQSRKFWNLSYQNRISRSIRSFAHKIDRICCCCCSTHFTDWPWGLLWPKNANWPNLKHFLHLYAILVLVVILVLNMSDLVITGLASAYQSSSTLWYVAIENRVSCVVKRMYVGVQFANNSHVFR